MKHELKQKLFRYFNGIKERTVEEQSLFLQLQGELDFFDVSSVSRDDVREKDFVADKLSDSDMEQLANRMDNTYLDCGFWEDLTENACELNFPSVGSD